MKKHVSLTISGVVHGVGFRMSAQSEARLLGIVGFAKNCEDGSVCIEAEGEHNVLDQFVAWCQSGPRHARVEKVDVQKGDVVGYGDFDIRRTSAL